MASAGTDTATIVTTYQDASGKVTLKSETVTADLSVDMERQALDAGVTNVEFDVPITVANIKAIAIGIGKSKGEAPSLTTTATIKTNSTSSPDNTLTVTGTNGVGWSKGDTVACPLTVDVTKFYVSNTGTGRIDIFIRAVIDSSPVEPG